MLQKASNPRKKKKKKAKPPLGPKRNPAS